ncbi:MAG: ATP-dependent helicase [Lachnospiraceae bacterium]|nr:ATP-dependent helicase [Lachnospiraceae bacterium]
MEPKEFMSKYAQHLNESQKKAVQAVDGPVLLLAVPGSGKTTVLVTRLGYMLMCKGIRPENILTLTYTVAATKDMANRFSNLFGGAYASGLEFRTINGICQKIILRYFKMTGKNDEVIFKLITDEKDSGRILTDILIKIMDEYPTESDVKGYKTLITYCKNMLFTNEEIEKLGSEEGIKLSEAYQMYNSYLVSNKLMDYDDQMVYAYRMLIQFPWLLKDCQDTYKYICVDEAQDTSKIQHKIISLLAGLNGNLFMVGDEDQSIYGFRAAYPEALLNFENEHPSALTLIMDTNYRSNPKIVDAADKFIQFNKERHEKHMRPTKVTGVDIRYIDLKNRRNQYNYLIKVAENCQTETAVLYRDNESALPLIDLLDRQGIGYRMKSIDMAFFTSRVVTDVTNIMRFAIDPCNTELFMRIYFKCQTYLRKAQAEEMCRISSREGITVLSAAEKCLDINGMVVGKCKAMSTNLASMLRETPDKALFRIENPMGYGEYLDRNSIDDNKLYILKLLAYSEDNVGSFLDRLGYLQEMLQKKEPDYSQKFILSTIHSSKGLEYDNVFLMDICDGVFPSKAVLSASHKSQEMKNLEEERRLFYVGMTRAKYELNIFCMNGETSRFIRELKGPEEKKELNKSGTRQDVRHNQGKTVQTGFGKKKSVKAVQKELPSYMKNEISKPKSSFKLRKGTRVIQDRFGTGTVTALMFKDGKNEGNFEVTYDTGEVKKYYFPMAFAGGMRLANGDKVPIEY